MPSIAVARAARDFRDFARARRDFRDSAAALVALEPMICVILERRGRDFRDSATLRLLRGKPMLFVILH